MSKDKSKGLQFGVNQESAIAVYIQIENQVKFAVASGRLAPGDNLPSVRDLSSALKVNPNTVAKAYRDLEITGLVKARRGVGYTVLAKGVSSCRAEVLSATSRHLREAVAECVASGLTLAEIRLKVTDAARSKQGPYA